VVRDAIDVAGACVTSLSTFWSYAPRTPYSANLNTAAQFGSRGSWYSPLTEMPHFQPYSMLQDAVGWMHNCASSLLKDWWYLLLSKRPEWDGPGPRPAWHRFVPSPAFIKLIATRTPNVSLTSMFGTLYRDITTQRGLWSMDEWGVFGETLWTFIAIKAQRVSPNRPHLWTA